MPTREAHARNWPAILDNGSRREIQAAAVEAARADIAAGRPKVAWTGGFACWAVGVPIEHIGLVKNLPNIPLPCGCTEPLLEQAAIYAEAYNKEVLPYLISRNESRK
jgi:hypothetical protein